MPVGNSSLLCGGSFAYVVTFNGEHHKARTTIRIAENSRLTL